MLTSFSARLAVVFGLIFSVAALLLTLWYFYSSSIFADEVEQKLHRGLAEQVVHDNEQLSQGIIDSNSLKDAFHTMMLLGPEWELYALDDNGEILAYSAPKGKVKRERVSLVPIQTFFEGGNLPVYGDDPRDPAGNKIFSVAPIMNPNGTRNGYLYVIIGSEKRDSLEALLATSQVLRDSGAILLLSLLFGLLLLWLMLRLLTRPLQELANRMQVFVDNQFNLPEPKRRHHGLAPPAEVVTLERAFENTAGHIADQLQQIKTTEQLRRELLSHVSHDLRTPLASLQGYLETWLLQEPHERQEALIQIALKNARQLHLLVDQLFELARLESGDIEFSPESVAVLDLIQDIRMRMGYQAEQQGVTLEIHHDEHNPAVWADIGKLERILVNLLDNAIRHTPKGGKVVIELDIQDQDLALAVRDTGQGIPDKELARIFEPRFRASNNDGRGGHAGLGLAIVKRLIEMHHSDIRVESTEEKGTAFQFTLPLVA